MSTLIAHLSFSIVKILTVCVELEELFVAFYTVVGAGRRCELSTLRRFKRTDLNRDLYKSATEPTYSSLGTFSIEPMSGPWSSEGPPRTLETLTQGFRSVSSSH